MKRLLAVTILGLFACGDRAVVPPQTDAQAPVDLAAVIDRVAPPDVAHPIDHATPPDAAVFDVPFVDPGFGCPPWGYVPCRCDLSTPGFAVCSPGNVVGPCSCDAGAPRG
jgi:hypothetical protein